MDTPANCGSLLPFHGLSRRIIMYIPKVYPVHLTLTQINFIQMLVNERRIEIEKSGKQPPMTLEILEDLREIFNEKLHEIGFGG